jgi:Alpha/beta-hydrolase family N-terminus
MAQSIPGPPVAEGPPAEAEGPQPSPEPAKPRKLLYVRLPGCWGALIFACLSFTPSLLPRGGIVQGLVCGITAAIGYGLGVLVAWVWRAFADRDLRRPRRRSWLAFFISAAVLYVVSFGLGQYWQYEIRKLMGVTDYNIPLVVASPFIAALVFCVLLLIGRGPVPLAREAAQPLDRAARREGGRLGAGGRRYLPGGQRPVAARLRQRHELRVFTARHDDRGGGAPAHDRPAVGRAGLAHTVGHAGLPGPQLHRQGPVGE